MARIGSIRRWQESITTIAGADAAAEIMGGMEEPTPSTLLRLRRIGRERYLPALRRRNR